VEAWGEHVREVQIRTLNIQDVTIPAETLLSVTGVVELTVVSGRGRRDQRDVDRGHHRGAATEGRGKGPIDVGGGQGHLVVRGKGGQGHLVRAGKQEEETMMEKESAVGADLAIGRGEVNHHVTGRGGGAGHVTVNVLAHVTGEIAVVTWVTW